MDKQVGFKLNRLLRGKKSQKFCLYLFSISFVIFLVFFGVRNLLLASQIKPITPITDNHGIQAIKIYTDREGVYEIGYKDLEQLGYSTKDINPTMFHLYLRSEEQPLWIVPDNDSYSLRFYARLSDSLYSAQNIYILKLEIESGDFTSIVEGNDTTEREVSINSIDSYTDVVHIEQNSLYFPQNSDEDHWFWNSIASGQSQTYETPIDEVQQGQGLIRVNLWSYTQDTMSPDHHLIIYVNNQIVLDQCWDGVGRKIIQGELTANLLINGINHIKIEAPGDTNAVAEINWINWIELEYPRNTIAIDHQLTFTMPQLPIQLKGFDNEVSIFDITNQKTPSFVEEKQSTQDGLYFQGVYQHRYAVVSQGGFLAPSGYSPISQTPDLLATGLGGSYVAIGPPDLLNAAKPLLDWRSEQGMQVFSIPVDAIYDQFNYGFPEPEAIQNFLVNAEQTWNPIPKYVLLVGDASYDPRNYIAPEEANQLPTFFIMTEYGGQTASDTKFALLDDDGLPDIAIGRLPARSVSEVNTYVSKVLQYEREGSSSVWHRRVLAIADGQDVAFGNDAQNFLNELQNGYQGYLYAPQGGTTDGKDQIINYFNEGYFLISYFGHGGVLMWGKDRLFTIEDVSTLSNDAYPIVINMTCLTGLFTHPLSTSIAEALIWQPNGGAIGVIAPTSLTLTYDQNYLSLSLARIFSQNKNSTLGEVFLQAQREVLITNAGTQDVLLTYLLFGDPALRISTDLP